MVPRPPSKKVKRDPETSNPYGDLNWVVVGTLSDGIFPYQVLPLRRTEEMMGGERAFMLTRDFCGFVKNGKKQ